MSNETDIFVEKEENDFTKAAPFTPAFTQRHPACQRRIIQGQGYARVMLPGFYCAIIQDLSVIRITA